MKVNKVREDFLPVSISSPILHLAQQQFQGFAFPSWEILGVLGALPLSLLFPVLFLMLCTGSSENSP